jgi:hypothetical protein
MGFNKHHINDQIKADGIDGACGITEEKRREMHIGSWWGNLTKRRHLEELGNDGSII